MGEPGNRVVRVKRHGEVDELEVIEAAMPTAGRGEARVRVLASGVEYTVAAGAMRPQISERISFDQVADAHHRLEGGGLDGKLVLCPDLPSPPRPTPARTRSRSDIQEALHAAQFSTHER